MGFSDYFINVYDDPHQEMWQSSVKFLTDVGDKNECENVIDDNGNQMG